MTQPSPLHDALDWWASRDSFGGFATAAQSLFPGWTPRRSSCRAPHREDRSPSFSLYRGRSGQWRFKDHSTGEKGGLVDFVMLGGIARGDACRWVMEKAFTAEAQRRRDETGFRTPPRLCDSAVQSILSEAELRRCTAMAESLIRDTRAQTAFASARGWQPDTLRGLALDGCLGLHDGCLVMLYPTGAKKRLKPLDPGEASIFTGPKFTWMLGKPDAPWRAEMLLGSTRRVHITEGESDAINLIDAGCEESGTDLVVAVPGASCWRDEWAERFRGLHVTLWPDPDQPGRRLAWRVGNSLADVAAKVETAGRKPSLFSQRAQCTL